HRTEDTAHLEGAVGLKGKRRRSNEVLYGQPGFHKILPIEEELIIITHVEHRVHQMQPLFAVHGSGNDT
ncbi:hypothetical protein HHFLNI_HHFLNI_04890, partial [Dysosmobacter welbionis]